MGGNFSPTPEQREAIDARGSALLISAGAGSGKTRVLTERLMSYLNDERAPCDVDDFLIITYTRAAAGELRGRIISAISEQLRADPKNRRMRRQSVLAHRAEIDTIHSFCGRIARENAHILGISPDFRIAEESECAAIKTAVAERLLDARYERLDEYKSFSRLVDTLSPGRDDARLAELTLDMYGKLRSHYDEERWIARRLEDLRLGALSDASDTAWGRLILKKASQIAGYWSTRALSVLDGLDPGGEEYRLFGACFEYASSGADAFLAASQRGWDDAAAAAHFAFPRAKPCKKGLFDDIKSEWERCRAGLRELAELFPASAEEISEDISAVYPVTEALLELVTDFSAEYLNEKRRRRIADFSDLEHFALKLLCDAETGAPTELAAEISARYREIMVDEYQDVSAIQERIFDAVSRGGRKLVAVGDVRQSIYRFRLAEPSIFLEKYRSFGDISPDSVEARDSGAGSENAPGRRAILSRSFRSRGSIIDAVNHVFSLVMSEEFGELDYTEREYLTPGPDKDGGPPVELDIISLVTDDGGEESADGYAPKLDKRECEARFIAARAKELIASGFILPFDGGRRADYSDVVILLRVKKHARIYRDALRELGIPAELPEAEAFFDRPEVETALALLSVIDNPRDDIALIAALRSPAYAFTPGELAEIRLSRPDGDFYDALVLYAGSDEKSRRFLTELEDFRALAPELGAERTLWLLYNRTELPALVSAETVSGAERRAGLMRLIEYARGAAATGRVSLFDFLRFVRKLREHNAGTDAASSSYGGTGAVRIMTAHKSKGLEFPIVFLADMSRQFNFTDSREKLLFHRELGVGPKRVDLERRIEYPTLPRLAIARKLADETMSEELRVLYVAMTRAQEKLIITYASGGAEDTLAKLAPHVRQFDASRFNASQVGARIPPYILSKQKSVGDILLLSALARPEARAMFDEQSRSVTEVARYGRPGVARNFDWDMRLIRVGKENVFSARGESTASLSPEKELPAPPSEQQPPPALVYPYPKAPELPSKLTVTELKNRRVDLEARADALPIEATRENEHKTPHARPDFITQSSALTGAERGTALHLAMRRLDFREYAGEEEVRRELDSLAATGYLSARRREAVDEAKILRFLRSTLGARVISSGQKSPELFREFKFSVFVPAEMYFPGGGKDEIMLQGVVDLAFREAEPNGGDGLVIVDFKTDRIAGLAALREKTTLYTPQIEAYMSAMERVTGLRAHEGILYFFDADEAVRV